mgnify:CR=1 FL=1
MGLILAVVSIGASAAPSISEDQLRRIAAIALEQQAEKAEPAKAEQKAVVKIESVARNQKKCGRIEIRFC